jgi:choline kinase
MSLSPPGRFDISAGPRDGIGREVRVEISKVVILSAGQGKRLLPLTQSRPKCLVELSGRSLLAWQLMALEAAGLREAVVVTGFAADAVDAEIADLALTELKVRTLFNPFYSVTDNLATCWLIRGELAGGGLLLNGDTLFEPAVAERLLAAPPAPITVTIDRKSTYDADDMKVMTLGDALLAIGKKIETYDAESIGLLRFSVAGAKAFAAGLERAVRQPDGLKRWYLSVIDDLAREPGLVQVRSIEGLDWAEMDFPADVARNAEMTARWIAGEAMDLGSVPALQAAH